MSNAAQVSPKILKASREAAEYKYDTSKYIIVDLQVKRDPQTGQLKKKAKNQSK